MARKSRAGLQSVTPRGQTVWRAAFYGRLSVEDGDDVEQNSIGNQKKIVLEYLRGRRDIVLAEAFADNGCTGMSFERPGFKAMMAAISAGDINCVIVKDVSRLGRSFILTSELIERTLPQRGVRLICLGDDYDSAEPSADASALMMPFRLVMNDAYARDVSRKIRSSIHTRMARGEFLPAAGSVPYGYIRNAQATTYDVDADAACVVIGIFEMRARGESFSAIARRLNEQGVPSPGRLRFLRGASQSARDGSALWQRGTIRRIAQDAVYTGRRVHGRVGRDSLSEDKRRRASQTWTVIEGAHPALISDALFDRVQQVNREERALREAYSPRAAVGHDCRAILRGKLFCGHCGGRMSPGKGCARRGSQSPSWVFYDCAACGESRYIREEAVMRALKNTLDMQLQLTVELEQLLGEAQVCRDRDGNRRCEDTLAGVRAKKRGVEGSMERLLRDVADGVLSREEYAYAREAYRKRLDALENREKQNVEESRALERTLCTSRAWLAHMMQYRKLPQIDGAIVEALVGRIVVMDGDSIHIELRFADPLSAVRAALDGQPEDKTDAG